MSPTRQTVFVVGEVVFIVAGFVVGLIGPDVKDNASLVGAAVGGGLAVFGVPWLMVLLVRLNIAVGFFKPPWKRPHLTRIPDSWDGPLPYFQLLAFVSTASGIGATISIAWNGVQAVPTALLGLCGGIALYLGLVRLIALFSRPDTEASARPPQPNE
jgi:hypothetical protein